MNAEDWGRVSEWHNAWLSAGAAERNRLRQTFADKYPALATLAGQLAEESHALPGFLETPAFTLAIHDLADGEPSLAIGASVGPYRIVGLLARGGMGDVYRATDVRLGRDVALKVLARINGRESQTTERFLQEARITASLDHPNIVKVFDVGLFDGQPYIVAELLEGETLRERISTGPLPVDQVLAIATQVSEGLVAAHAAGLVHRDLKPENIFITHGTAVKILDFGIAKLDLQDDRRASLATATRVVLGTAGYLAPEQVRGDAVDGRTDLFACGTIVFEMLTGGRPFARENTIDTLHAILHEPTPPTALASMADVPPALTAIVMRLLEKAPAGRFQSAADLTWALKQVHGMAGTAHVVIQPSGDSAGRMRRGGRNLAALAAGAIALVAGAGALGFFLRSQLSPRSEAIPVHFVVPPPEGHAYVRIVPTTFLGLSPDGSQLAFVATAPEAPTQIWLRPIAGLEARAIPGTEGATSVFWSPDSRSIAFFAANKLKRIDLPGGSAVPICDVGQAYLLHGTWGSTGTILFAASPGEAIYSVPAAGGTPEVILKPDPSRGETRTNWPWFLPDGKRFLYLTRLRDGGGQLMIGERGRTARSILPLVSNAQWVDPDYLVFVRDGVLVGQRFDLDSERVVGEPFSIAGPVDYFFTTARANFAASRNGTIAYHSYTDVAGLAWVDRAGKEGQPFTMSGGFDLNLRMSPDGRRVAFNRPQAGTGTHDIWTRDLVRDVEERITFDVGSEVAPVWLPSGRGIVFVADRGGAPHLFRRDLVTGVEAELRPAGQQQFARDVSPDERTLVFTERTALGNFDIFTLPLTGLAAPSPLVSSRFEKPDARLSPDGRALVYVSNESGRFEVYVAPLSAVADKVLVSAGVARGLENARWSRDGREIFYVSVDRLMISVPVVTAPSLRVGAPKPLFSFGEKPIWSDFDVAPDGRFLAFVPQSHGGDKPLSVVVNWTAEVRR